MPVKSSSSSSHFVKVPTDTLLIVESPAKCSTIIKHLGPGYRCVATMGHVRHIDGLDSIDIKNNYKINLTTTSSIEYTTLNKPFNVYIYGQSLYICYSNNGNLTIARQILSNANLNQPFVNKTLQIVMYFSAIAVVLNFSK